MEPIDPARWVQYQCAFCGKTTTDDPRYAQVDLWWPNGLERQTFGTHVECLRAALAPGFPLAVD